MRTTKDSYSNLVQLDEVVVTNFDKVPGDNFQVFYTEQAPSYVMPRSTYQTARPQVTMVAAPVAGLTNAQVWDTYKLAIGGRVAPCSNTRATIIGFVCTNVPPAELPPRLIIEHPGTGMTLPTSTVPLYLGAYGDRTGFHHMGIQLDTNPVFAMALTGYSMDLTNIAPGKHVLRAHMARADNSIIAGSEFETTFTVAGTVSSSVASSSSLPASSSVPSSSSIAVSSSSTVSSSSVSSTPVSSSSIPASSSSIASSASSSGPRQICFTVRLPQRARTGQNHALSASTIALFGAGQTGAQLFTPLSAGGTGTILANVSITSAYTLAIKPRGHLAIGLFNQTIPLIGQG